MFQPISNTFLTSLLLLLTTVNSRALPQEDGQTLDSAAIDSSSFPPATEAPSTSTTIPDATSTTSTTTTDPPPTDTPQVFIDAERGIVVESLDPSGVWVDDRWRGLGRMLRAFQFNDTYLTEYFQASFYPVDKDWNRQEGPDPDSYYSWTTGAPTMVATVTASPTIDVTLSINTASLPTQTPNVDDVAQLSCR
ncbi:hypothetical protein L486_05128 [Kwoniella mangroviensis CBS 10435]|uniref:GH16 domain-containing protein n=1 Tax=Kwoniella mangroviensis CBS 10435 TaxID=1331196 RepID=A0A1B9IQ20_9TREE|nr:uncharacterized protein I203_00137 [Kwoniella mangroviensis CBS 8507]OCF57666.1 hypothetical protein L486_05128 [Kwoniella mangroviensis CBS 10435]OCF70008.1 hypothetical protein I203_00137 [Kwoniella mangroviensis CBS 8507]OCF75786.1 hypothetical protein I204_03080 [Kwoniella mangroviensis CBS 8886]